MGPTACNLQSQVVSACQSFRPRAPFIFSVKNTIFGSFFLIQKELWPYRYAYHVPLVTLILNMYGFLGLAPFFFLAKVPSFFIIQKEVWPYRHAHNVLVTLIINIYGFVGLTSSVNRRYTDRQIVRQTDYSHFSKWGSLLRHKVVTTTRKFWEKKPNWLLLWSTPNFLITTPGWHPLNP